MSLLLLLPLCLYEGENKEEHASRTAGAAITSSAMEMEGMGGSSAFLKAAGK